MRYRLTLTLTVLLTATFANLSYAHGLIQSPPARNWYCGAVTKPDQVQNGTAQYPVCGEAFIDDFNGGYQFMSVLTHAEGRSVVTPLPENVCGFNSETFNDGPTPWDKSIDWPTTNMNPGRNKITWNISWGPHFDDTKEFKYWITKPNFQYQVGTPLTWNDFEPAPFCSLEYDDANPAASPNVIANKADTQFDTFCDVPQRSGRHVIYGEWGRNQFTFERFHGCVDVVMNGGDPLPTPSVDSVISGTPSAPFVGAGAIELNGGNSVGENLTYQWSIDSSTPELYELTNANSEVASLSLANPQANTRVSVSLTVSDGAESDTSSVSISHQPLVEIIWEDLGALTNQARDLAVNDKVSIRTVLENGQDVFYPVPAMEISTALTGANIWPYELAIQINQQSNNIAIGVLNSEGQVQPIQSATANRIYARSDYNAASAFLIVESAPVTPPPPPTEGCSVNVRNGANPWWAGFDLGTDSETTRLDFSNTGINLQLVSFDAGVFSAEISGNQVILTKPQWVNQNNPGYFGMNANNYAALASVSAPSCQ